MKKIVMVGIVIMAVLSAGCSEKDSNPDPVFAPDGSLIHDTNGPVEIVKTKDGCKIKASDRELTGEIHDLAKIVCGRK